MTVAELIDVLKNYDDNAKVYVAVGRKKYDASTAVRISQYNWEIVSNDVVIISR